MIYNIFKFYFFLMKGKGKGHLSGKGKGHLSGKGKGHLSGKGKGKGKGKGHHIPDSKEISMELDQLLSDQNLLSVHVRLYLKLKPWEYQDHEVTSKYLRMALRLLGDDWPQGLDPKLPSQLVAWVTRNFRDLETNGVDGFFQDLKLLLESLLKMMPDSPDLQKTCLAFVRLSAVQDLDLKSLRTFLQTPVKPYEHKRRLVHNNILTYHKTEILVSPEELLKHVNAPAGRFSRVSDNLVGERFESFDHLLDCHYHLLREDFLSCFLDGLATEYTSTWERNLNVQSYDVRWKGYQMSPSGGVLYLFKIKTSRVLKRLAKKGLLEGNLVLITRASKTLEPPILYGTLVRKPFNPKEDEDPITKGEFAVRFCLDADMYLKAQTEFSRPDAASTRYKMIESRCFFLPYEKPLRIMRAMTNPDPTIVEALISGILQTPRYITDNPIVKISASILTKGVESINVLSNDDWSACEDWTLEKEVALQGSVHVVDDSQKESLKQMFQKNVCVVQGTPGTGKSFIGAKFLQLLVQNFDTLRPGSIVVLALTNHALDCVLSDCLDFMSPDEIVRVGSRSKDERLASLGLMSKMWRSRKRLNYGKIVDAMELLNSKYQKLSRNPKVTSSELFSITSTSFREIEVQEETSGCSPDSSEPPQSVSGAGCLLRSFLKKESDKHSQWLKFLRDDLNAKEIALSIAQEDLQKSEILWDEEASKKVACVNNIRSLKGRLENLVDSGFCDASDEILKKRISETSLRCTFLEEELDGHQKALRGALGIVPICPRDLLSLLFNRTLRQGIPGKKLDSILANLFYPNLSTQEGRQSAYWYYTWSAINEGLLKVHGHLMYPTLVLEDARLSGEHLLVSLIEWRSGAYTSHTLESILRGFGYVNPKSIIQAALHEDKIREVETGTWTTLGINRSFRGVNDESDIFMWRTRVIEVSDELSSTQNKMQELKRVCDFRSCTLRLGQLKEELEKLEAPERLRNERQAEVNRLVAEIDRLTKLVETTKISVEEPFQVWRLEKGEGTPEDFMLDTPEPVEPEPARVDEPLDLEPELREVDDFQPMDQQEVSFVNGMNADSRALIRQRIVSLLSGDTDSLNKNQRETLAACLRLENLNRIDDKIQDLINESELSRREIEDEANRQKYETLSEHMVVGATTIGACNILPALVELKPKVLVVEEAAEILESHILACLTPSVEHLILIGDHLQLSPKVQKMHHKGLGISMMQRLVALPMPDLDGPPPEKYVTLRVQRRMHPSISQWTHSYYLKEEGVQIEDHPSTFNLKEISGVAQRVAFINVAEGFEAEHPGLQSKLNSLEAEAVLATAKYLSLQKDMAPDKIAIIVPYTGQLMEVQRLAGNHDISISGRTEEGKIRVSTIDNYQGEEADVVLVSLTRTQDIGFMKTLNRACVMLSRARRGMYVFGNLRFWRRPDIIIQNFILSEFLDKLNAEGGIFSKFCGFCEAHSQKLEFLEMDEFQSQVNPQGGCLTFCREQKKCTHVCGMLCHPNTDHGLDKCRDICGKSLDCGHPCTRICSNCSEQCGLCLAKVEATCPDCHEKTKKTCHMTSTSGALKCKNLVTIDEALCGHRVTIRCSDRSDPAKVMDFCNEWCRARLPCGHTCPDRCHKGKLKEAHAAFAGCKGTCLEKLECGHDCAQVCGSPKPHKCKALVEKVLPCGHTAKKVPCSKPPEKILCTERCGVKLSCSHQCMGQCGDCRKGVNGLDHLWLEHPPCRSPQDRSLVCGHLHIGHPCSEKTPRCKNRCDNRCSHLDCSKVSKHNCADECPPCLKKCEWQCTHVESEDFPLMQCTMKCKEACNRPHCNLQCGRLNKCGHQCPGLCGERCPSFCPVCLLIEGPPLLEACKFQSVVDRAGYQEIIEGFQNLHDDHLKESDLELFKLPPDELVAELYCGHTYKVTDLKGCLRAQLEDSKVKVPTCPAGCGQSIHPSDFLCMKTDLQSKWADVRHAQLLQKNLFNDRFKEVTDVQMYAKTVLLELIQEDSLPEFQGIPAFQGRPHMKRNKKPGNEQLKIAFDQYSCAVESEIEAQQIWIAEKIDSKLTEYNCGIGLFLQGLLRPLYRMIYQVYELEAERVKFLGRQIQLAERAHFLLGLYNKFKTNVSSGKTSLDDLLAEFVQQVDPNFWVEFGGGGSHEKRSFDMLSINLEKIQTSISLITLEATCLRYNSSQQAIPERLECWRGKLMALCVSRNDQKWEFLTDKQKKHLEIVTKEYCLKSDLDPPFDFKNLPKIMGLSANHAYKCPCGEIYFIGECGGAMEVSKCAACKERTGGESHRLDKTNSFAGKEFSSSASPAYPL